MSPKTSYRSSGICDPPEEPVPAINRTAQPSDLRLEIVDPGYCLPGNVDGIVRRQSRMRQPLRPLLLRPVFLGLTHRGLPSRCAEIATAVAAAPMAVNWMAAPCAGQGTLR